MLMSAAGRLFTQETARRYAKLERLILICGRYEGVDERVAESWRPKRSAVGDYVLSGGELPAAIVVDAVTRLLPGALGNEASAENESFSRATCNGNSIAIAVSSRTAARLPALHPPSGISRLEGARGPYRWQSRRSGQVAPETGHREDSAKPARPYPLPQ